MKLVFPRLYAIMDASLLNSSEQAVAEMLAQSGAALIQYRNKQSSARRLFESVSQLLRILRPLAARLVVNDRPDIAALSGADGVHVGQQDLGPAEARAIVGPACCVGVSTHSLEQVRAAADSPADYIAVGPIFPTATKERPDPVVGLDFIRLARALTDKPLVAIGGITLERAPQVFAAGADSLAVARDLLTAADPVARVRQFLKVAQEATRWSQPGA